MLKRKHRIGFWRIIYNKLIRASSYLIVGWLFFAPLAYLVPKRKKTIIFIGYEGLFYDNVKYLYLYLNRIKDTNMEFYFITENKEVFAQLKAASKPVVFYPSWEGCWKLLMAYVAVIGFREWTKKFRYFMLIKSHKVQLWHGVGFKKIEKELFDLQAGSHSLRKNIEKIFFKRFPAYDVVISTSKFYSANVFLKTFNTKKIIETGYPRNDHFFSACDRDALIGADTECIEQTMAYKEKKYKVVLYAPTFRTRKFDLRIVSALNLKETSSFCQKHRIIFILKFHAYAKYMLYLDNAPGIIRYGSPDAYPLLPLIDLLITDYSSIYMDFLFLDRPILFFPYDYKKRYKGLQFIYSEMAPGPKCFENKTLFEEIRRHLIDGCDEYQQKRKEIFNIAFQYKDGKASERIWDFIKTEYAL